MSDTLQSVTDEIFATLPPAVAEKFDSEWRKAIDPVIERRGPVPDQKQHDDVYALCRAFFIHGYVAGTRQVSSGLRAKLEL